MFSVYYRHQDKVIITSYLKVLNVLIHRYPPLNLKVQSTHLKWTSLTSSFCITFLPLLSPSSPPPGGLSAGQPNSQLPGAAVRPPPLAPPVGGHLPGPHLAELWPGTLVWSPGQRPREALHPAVGSHPRGERLIPVFSYIWKTTGCFFYPFQSPALQKGQLKKVVHGLILVWFKIINLVKQN